MKQPLRIYLTGSRGILGRHVRVALERAVPGCSVLCNSADLTDLAATSDALRAAGPLDLVVHLAALVPVDAVLANPARGYAVNTGGTINLLAALPDVEAGVGGHQAARLVHCSSGHVYAAQDRPIREDDPTVPISVYGKTKLLGEQAAREICAETGRALCVARLFSLHDPAQTGNYLRPSLERRLATADPEATFELHGAGSLRDFLTAEAAAQQLVRLALSSFDGVVNLGSGRAQTVAEFAQSLAPFPLKIKPIGTDTTLVPDVSLLNGILGEAND
ncbi:NAD-dependent epimerase/dehydratase family protein [Tritonibacter sp. SIMBA_163]|uniref:NAD-dependent epimerase/dehydratase family protein n=1 Tax=Tritonibacter sp. SIMBA_163 TaxID=3080868 RepID=UPI0039802AC2